MPHLAPLKWLLMTMFFWLLLITLMSMSWWHSTPKINPFSLNFSTAVTPTWPWS